MYWIKLFLPFNLCTFYPFPSVKNGLPAAYYIAPLFFLITTVSSWIVRKKTTVPIFSVLFFFITIALVLQFFPIGSAIYADRYAYIPSWAVFFLLGYGIHYLTEVKRTFSSSSAYISIAIIGLILTFLCYKQSKTWKDAESLWQQAVKVSPNDRSYSKLAEVYRDSGKVDFALENYTKAIAFNADDSNLYFNRANIYYSKKDYKNAISDYDLAIKIKPESKTLSNRGWCYAEIGANDLAFKDFQQSIDIDPTFIDAYRNRGFLYERSERLNEALKDFEKCETLQPENPDVICQVGIIQYKLQNWQSAFQYFDKACKLKPTEALYYFNRSKSRLNMNDKKGALIDAQNAHDLGFNVPEEYFAQCR